MITHDLVEDEPKAPNLQHLFTPERLIEIDAAVAEIKEGKSFTADQVREHFKQKRVACDRADRA